MIQYPTEEKIIELNLLSIELIKAKRADRTEVLSHNKITKAIDECKEKKGDIYDKSVVLLKELVKNHPFASGNRRTAFIATKYLLEINKNKFGVPDDENQANVMQGIREDYYSDNEIKEWLKNGKIREFKR